MPDTQPEAAYPRYYDELTQQRQALDALSGMQEELGLAESLDELNRIATLEQYPLYGLPEDAPDDLVNRQIALQQKMDILSANAGGLAAMEISAPKKALLASIVQTFLEEVRAFEVDAMEQARTSAAALIANPDFTKERGELRDALGIQGQQELFDDVLRELATPIAPPNPDEWKHEPAIQQKLEDEFATLQQLQYEFLTFVIDPSLRELKDRNTFADALENDRNAKLDSAEVDAILKAFAAFLYKKQAYETRLQKIDDPKPSKFYAILGTSMEEAIEESAEDWLKFKSMPDGKMPVLRFLKTPEWLQKMDTASRQRLLGGFRQARLMVGSRAPALSQVLRSMEASPLGSKFWKQLLTIESPVTVMLYAMHVHTSGNPLKATMEFGSFLATSAASGALLQTTTRMLAQTAIWAQRAGNTQMATRLLVLARLPKHPAVQFAAAIAIAMGMAPLINQITGWVDEQIPDGPGKQALNDGISVVSGSSIIESMEFLGNEAGLWNVDPETDAFSYLSKEVLTMHWDGTGLQHRKMNGVTDWNDKIRRASAAETNPLMQQLYELEYADHGGGDWTARQAFELYSVVEHARGLQSAIAGQLVERGIIQQPHSFDLLWAATSSSIDERPDRAVAHLEDDTSSATGKAVQYLQGLKNDDALSQLWKQYRPLVKHVATRVSTYRHIGVYKEQEWVGRADDGQMPELVQKGIAASINYRMRRQEILRYKEGNGYSEQGFMRLVHDVEQRRALRDVPLKLAIADERPWPNPFTNPGDWLDKLRQHNDLNQNSTDRADRRFLSEMLGRMQAEATQNENLFRFVQASEKILHQSQEEPQLAMQALTLAFAESLPDSELIRGKRTVPGWREPMAEMSAKFDASTDPIERLYLQESRLQMFLRNNGNGAGGVPQFSWSKNLDGLSMSCNTQFEFDPKTQEWFVNTRSSASMNFIVVELGRHHFPTLNLNMRQPYTEWRKIHPEAARAIAPDLLWHQEWVGKLQAQVDTAKLAYDEHMQSEEMREVREADEIREKARSQPKQWHTYGKKVNPQNKSDRYIFDYVGYDNDKNRFVYLQAPELDTGPKWVSADTVTSTTERTIVRVVRPNGSWYQCRVLGNYQYSIRDYDNGNHRDCISSIGSALSYPIRLNESIRAKPTLINILAVYVKEGELGSGKWDAAIDSALSDAWYTETPERAEMFFRMLNLQLLFATHENGTASKEWNYLTQAKLTTAVQKARESTKNWEEDRIREQG